ncbi:hypothetical protein ACFVY1_22430 [Streptomyces sp. NPDC058293]
MPLPTEPVGRVGQFTPSGTGGTLPRSVSHFDRVWGLTPAITPAA